MPIEPITFHEFDCIAGVAAAPCAGCGWFATHDRRTLGILYLDADVECFRFNVLRSADSGWLSDASSESFEHLDDAEAALRTAMLIDPRRVEITVSDAPFQLRRGVSRNRSARGNAKPY